MIWAGSHLRLNNDPRWKKTMNMNANYKIFRNDKTKYNQVAKYDGIITIAMIIEQWECNVISSESPIVVLHYAIVVWNDKADFVLNTFMLHC